ncbi:peroxiredoxin [Paracoccus cavernae]|uniref:Glutathione-dependent peroxiredoxin n=1 Tax=Paracoccus cavernae TaxID=1571207 RepID=A0ABT8D550_9RHOB|nr:peroxiredoxin [Paracoccus cavernae]
MLIGDRLPQVTFQTRIYDPSVSGPNPYRWQGMTTDDFFKGKRVLLFSLPGAFTPTCSTYQLPGFEAASEELKRHGLDEIYCLSVNDAFVMNQWAKSLALENVKVIPDGSGEFTERVGMLVRKDNLGFGARSWRYAAIIDDCVVEAWFEEPGRVDDCPSDPYGTTAPETLLEWLRDNPKQVSAA